MTRTERDKRDLQRAVANILAVYLDAPALTQLAGRKWYAEERARCAAFARRRRLTLAAVAGAAAAISPGLRWDTTFSHLAALLQNPRVKVPTYNREFVRRALACLAGSDPRAVLSGPKVTAFYGLLSGSDFDAVVIDGHAWNVCRMASDVFRCRPGYAPPAAARVNDRRYRIAAAAFREAAEVLGEAPHSVQACTWIHWKNLHARERDAGED